MLVNLASTSDGLKYTESRREKNACVIVLTYTQRKQRMQADMRRRDTERRQKLARAEELMQQELSHSKLSKLQLCNVGD